jgi:L-threonylcarbamoyladenylate synthase
LEGNIIEDVNNQVFLYPTDTVWGIGASIYSESACREIHEIKGSSSEKPLSILFSNISMVLDYIEFPKQMTREWLEEFFTLESTLGIPLSWLKKDVPKWISCDSPHLCIRCLEIPEVKNIIDKLGNPIITTSINKTGEAPLITHKEVLDFVKNVPHDYKIVNLDNPTLSGDSSTIIFFDETVKMKVIRKGTKIIELEKHLEVLST